MNFRSYILPTLAMARLFLSDSLAAAATYGVRVDPMATVTAAVFSGHGIDMKGECQINEDWAVNLGGLYSFSRPVILNALSTESRRKQESTKRKDDDKAYSIDSQKQQQVSVSIFRYHGSRKRLYANLSIAGSRSEAYVRRRDERGRLRLTTLLPEAGYGYRWLFRHGGYVALGGGLVYQYTMKRQLEGDEVAKDGADTVESIKVLPAFRLGVGYQFQ